MTHLLSKRREVPCLMILGCLIQFYLLVDKTTLIKIISSTNPTLLYFMKFNLALQTKERS